MPPARILSAKKPKNLRYTLRTLLSYMGRHKYLLLLVAVLVVISAMANLLGTYMIRPVVNSLSDGGMDALLQGVVLTAAIYLAGALASLGYTQTMVKAAQKVLFDIRRDLFSHLQTLPLRFFDARRHGDIMSYFTNDVDTIADALNNSFAMVIQSFIQVVGTLTMLFILNWQLTLVVAVCYVVMFLYIRYSGRRSKAYYRKQQENLGDLDGYIEEMVAGQKVVKVFNHENENLRRFREKNEALRKAGTGRPGLRRHHDPSGSQHLLHQLRHRGGPGWAIWPCGVSPTWAALPAIWCSCGRPPCPSTSSLSRAISCWLPLLGPSGCLRPWTNLRRRTMETSCFPKSRKAAGPGKRRMAPRPPSGETSGLIM